MWPSQFEAVGASRRNVLTLFPGALGDFLCFVPALLALRSDTVGCICVCARMDWLSLIEDGPFELRSIEHRAIAELYSGSSLSIAEAFLCGFSEIHSWTGHGNAEFARRLQVSSAAERISVHPFRAFRPGEHAVDYYARCLGLRPAKGHVLIRPEHRPWGERWLCRHNPQGRSVLMVHNGSGSDSKSWQGFARVVDWWRSRGGFSVELVGPGEVGRDRLAVDAIVEEPLPRVAALLERATAYAGNDCGITHLAATLDVPGVAVYGQTSTRSWYPRSRLLRVASASDTCDRCSPDVFCVHRLPSQLVVNVLRTAVGRAQRWQERQ